jgi:coniferyl-aldehyde dehydrogenase
MNAPFTAPAPTAADAELDRLFARQRAAFAAERYPAEATRRDRLERLIRMVRAGEDALVAAIDADFGHRSAHETRLAEIYVVVAGARHAQKRLARWMAPRRVATPLHLKPGRARILRQPLGVVGIVSPWNYPLQLALAPAVGALAAGNRVLVKPSELTPRLSALLRELVAGEFAPDEFAVVEGDAAVGQAFCALPWDHLFFTGSTAVGRQVAQAAAANLVPVTLELGGKSPALFDADADFAAAAPRLVSGKLLNAGQTCIAPDYALVPAGRVDAFVAAVKAAAAQLYPSIAANPDYTAIVNERHHARLAALAADAQAKGATIVSLDPTGATLPAAGRKLAPALVVGVDDSMAIMHEEIFGPLLPVEAYTTLDDAIARVNARPRPLAFYYFGRDGDRRERVLRETIAGGVTVNDTLWHFVHEELPFGGVGASGIGAYHGEASFATFSHAKPVFVQPGLSGASLLYPPYGRTFERMLALLKKLGG